MTWTAPTSSTSRRQGSITGSTTGYCETRAVRHAFPFLLGLATLPTTSTTTLATTTTTTAVEGITEPDDSALDY